MHIQRKHGGIGQPVCEPDLARKHDSSNSTMNRLNKTVQNNPYAECDRIQEITDELVELKTIFSKHFLKGDVAQIIEQCCAASIVSGNNMLLKSYLEWGHKGVRFRERLVMLGQGMPYKDISRMLMLAFTRAVNSPVFRDADHIGSQYGYVPQECKQQAVETDPSTAGVAFNTKNRDYPVDQYVYYFGVSEETFFKDFQAWQRRNPSSIASLF